MKVWKILFGVVLTAVVVFKDGRQETFDKCYVNGFRGNGESVECYSGFDRWTGKTAKESIFPMEQILRVDSQDVHR